MLGIYKTPRKIVCTKPNVEDCNAEGEGISFYEKIIVGIKLSINTHTKILGT